MRLLDVEPGLAVDLPAAELAFARRELLLPTVVLSSGSWEPAETVGCSFAVFLLEGLVSRDDVMFGRPDIELFGSGDVLDPRLFTGPASTWVVLTPARLALVDEHALAVARRCPTLMARLLLRLFDGHCEHRYLAAIRALPRVEDRIHALMAHQASRWGHVTPEGTALHLPITHEVLGRLVGSRRPTISLALAALTHQGRLHPLGEHRWLIPATNGTAP